MKKNISTPLLLLLAMSSLSSATTLQEQIQITKEKIQKLQSDLKRFEEIQAILPKNVAQRKAEIIAIKEKENELTTHAEFGFVSTSGNTDTTSYNLDLHMKKGWNKHIFEFTFDSQFADDNSVQTKNKFLSELEYDFEFTPRFAFHYLVDYKNDKFSGYSYQSYTGPGMKYKIIKKDKHDLSLEGNILYSQDDIQDTHTVSNYTSLRAKAVYEFQILQNLKFTQDLSYRTEIERNENYFLFSKTAFISKISDIFSLGINYKLDYINIAPEAKAHTDRTFSASLIIDY